jgi:hypothetical protein
MEVSGLAGKEDGISNNAAALRRHASSRLRVAGGQQYGDIGSASAAHQGRHRNCAPDANRGSSSEQQRLADAASFPTSTIIETIC